MKKEVVSYCSVVLLGIMLLAIRPAVAQKAIERKGPPSVKVALQAYSFSKLLNDNVKGRGAGMSLYDLLDFSAKNNFDAVDLTGYFFPGYPNVPGDDYINGIKRRAFELGLDICGTGVRNDFADPDPAKRAADVKHVKEWIDVAVKLGAPLVRIFSGNIPEGYNGNWNEIAKYMAEDIKECVAYGRKRGILIGVQNHGDFLKTADETIKLVKLVNSEWFGVIVDTGYFLTSDPYTDIEKVMPYAVNFLLKESPVPGGSTVKTDLKRIMKIVKGSSYRGYLPIETLSSKGPSKAGTKSGDKKLAYDPYTVVPVFLKEVRRAVSEEFKN